MRPRPQQLGRRARRRPDRVHLLRRRTGADHADFCSFDRAKTVEVSLGYQNVKVVSVIERHGRASSRTTRPAAPTASATRIINRLKSLKGQAAHRRRGSTSRPPTSPARSPATRPRHRGDRDASRRRRLAAAPTSCSRISTTSSSCSSAHGGSATDVCGSTAKGPALRPRVGRGERRVRAGLPSFDDRLRAAPHAERAGRKVKVTARNQVSKSTFTGEAARDEVGLNADLRASLATRVRKKVKDRDQPAAARQRSGQAAGTRDHAQHHGGDADGQRQRAGLPRTSAPAEWSRSRTSARASPVRTSSRRRPTRSTTAATGTAFTARREKY